AKWRQARNRSLKHQWSSTGVRTRARRLRQSNCYYTGERLQGETRFLTANLFCPFRALLFSTPDPIPRAMPWAGMSLPLRGEIQEAQLQNSQGGGKCSLVRDVIPSRATKTRVSESSLQLCQHQLFTGPGSHHSARPFEQGGWSCPALLTPTLSRER